MIMLNNYFIELFALIIYLDHYYLVVIFILWVSSSSSSIIFGRLRVHYSVEIYLLRDYSSLLLSGCLCLNRCLWISSLILPVKIKNDFIK